MADNPHKVADIHAAIAYIRMLHFSEINPSEADMAQLKSRIWNDIDWVKQPVSDEPAERRSQRDHPVGVIAWYRRPYWAAATVVLLVAAASSWMYQMNSSLTYQTAYGKRQEIRLADGSVVMLNANSSLKVANDLMDNPIREVWLEGEAYFDIAKRKGAAFVVHTAETDVEVVGTEFNVNTRRKQTHVVLHEGKVQLRTDNQATVVMQPGDMAVVAPDRQQVRLSRVEPDRHDAWKESYIVLDGRTLPDIIHMLEDTFGVTIKIQDSTLVSKNLTGKLHTDVAEDCIENLATILEADIEKVGDVYWYK